MKLYVKNKLASLAGSSEVLDENQEMVYKIKGKFFSITRKKQVLDKDGNLLYRVRNKFWHFYHKSAFIYNANKEKILTVKEKIGIKKYNAYGPEDEYKIDGSFASFSMQIYKNEELVGVIKTKIDILKDSYELEFENPEDAAFLVALVIALDNIGDR